MKNWIKALSDRRKALLFIIPVLYLILGGYFRSLLGNLSLRSCDPDYIYFISGLTLADGTFNVGHIDNPGTPLQILVALVFRITWIIRAVSTPFVEDVFLHPDLYLSVTNLCITGLTAAFLFFAGSKVYKYTRSVLYGILIQTAPLLPVIWYDLIGRVTPELLMTFPVVMLIVLLIRLQTVGKQMNYRLVFWFALVSAFGLSVKLNYLPLWLIPFLVLDSWGKRFSFAGLGLLLFFVIAFPVTLRFNIFWGWVKNLFLHSGTYGGGEANFIDLQAMKNNLMELIGYEKRFFYLFLSLAGLLILFLAVKKDPDRKITTRLVVAVLAAVVIQILMVGKHYAHRYFIPVLMLSPLMVYAAAEMILKITSAKYMKMLVGLGILLILFTGAKHNHFWLNMKTEAMGTDIKNRMGTWHFVSTLEKDSYRIITSQNYGSPLIEYTLMYSMAWAANEKKEEYKAILARLYPYTWQYTTWDDKFQFWGDPFDINKIIQTGKPVFLYIENDSAELLTKTLNKLDPEEKYGITPVLIFKNKENLEVVYKLLFAKNDPILEFM